MIYTDCLITYDFILKDLAQGAAAISPVSARPLLTPHQVQFPKHQGK